jgi:hypothetical protein
LFHSSFKNSLNNYDEITFNKCAKHESLNNSSIIKGIEYFRNAKKKKIKLDYQHYRKIINKVIQNHEKTSVILKTIRDTFPLHPKNTFKFLKITSGNSPWSENYRLTIGKKH